MNDTFIGYKRRHGPPGIRNYVVVVSGELSCSPWTTQIAAGIRGCVALTHKHGMGNVGPDRAVFRRVLSNVLRHPNVYAAVLVASGDEDYDPRAVVNKAQADGYAAHLVGPPNGGAAGDISARGRALVRRLAERAKKAKRVEAGLESLRVGLNCAGTDVMSPLTSHAACGAAMDLLVQAGATVLLSECPEMIGLTDTFFRRARSAAVKRKLKAVIAEHRRRLLSAGESLDEHEMCPFNVQGGLQSLRAKSRVSVAKAGTGRIQAVLDYGAVPARSGLVVMDGPAMTDFVMTGLLGAGAHLMVNCCGAGPANGMPVMVGADSVAPLLPVVKVTGGTAYFRARSNRIDFDAGPLATIPGAAPRFGARLRDLIVKTASGKKTRTEHEHDFRMNFPMRHHQA